MTSTSISAEIRPMTLRDHLLVVWAASGVVLPVLTPNIGPVILLLSMLAPVLLADRAQFKRNVMQPDAVTAVLTVIVFYLCLNVLFATVTDNAVGAIVTIALAGAACRVGSAAFPAMQSRDLQVMARGIMCGALLVAALLLVEYLSRMSLLRVFQHAVQAANMRFIRVDAGTWEAPPFTYLSRNLIVLIMLVWAAVACLCVSMRPAVRRVAVPAFLLSVFASALLSPSATAKAGLFAGAAAWVLARQAPRITAGILYVGWVTASLACIPIAHLIHRLRPYDIDWISSSLRHRMMIWSASADWFWQHPFIGLGMGGARKINLNVDLSISAPGIEAEPLNWHAHNIFVQAWFESGAIGGLLLCLLGVMLLRAIFRLPARALPYAVATFVSIFVIGLTGFSLWASWYLAGYGLAALCILMTVFINRDEVALPGAARG